ncbi:hypothetical protein WG954_12455 [Lacibacter sp. H375]|uniref:hypothetical protein n=1 Tax=Lacibacter sp. H375 TaxID=3133424 RepID=UPI0030C1D669
MKPGFICIFAIALFSMLVGCKKESNQSGVNMKIKTTGGSRAGGRISSGEIAGRTTGSITWTSGFASVNEIEFEAEKEGDENETEFKSKAAQRIDLFSPLESLGFINVPPGMYEEVEFEVHLAATSAAPALELRGTYNATPIVFRINDSFEVEAEFEDFSIPPNADINAIVSLNLDLLTSGITDAALNAATLTNGEIVISANSNVALYNIIRANFNKIDDVEVDDDNDD